MDYSLIMAVSAIIGVFFNSGLVLYLVKRKHEREDMIPKLCDRLDRVGEALDLSLESIVVIMNALRDGKINGESERQKEKIEGYFRKITSEGFKIRRKYG